MKKMLSLILVCFSVPVLLVLVSCNIPTEEIGDRAPVVKSVNISINTKEGVIRIGDQVIEEFALSKIEPYLGKPDRVETHKSKKRYEEHGYGDSPSTSTMISITDYYYIYDDLGLIFYTANGKWESKTPERLSVCFGNERVFDNTAPLPYVPKSSFEGELTLNQELIHKDDNLLPEGVDYLTDEFEMFQTLFGPTSIGGVIDRLYSIDARPGLMIYLDSEESQKISRFELRVL